MRDNFRIDGSLPNSPSNDLGVLRAEIKNENSFGAILGGTGILCLQEHYFTDSAKIVKRDRSICSQSLTIPGPIIDRLRRLELSRLLRCAREDLNLHGLPRYHLKVVRLPVSPRARNENDSLSAGS